MGLEEAVFAVPLALKLHDGIEAVSELEQALSLVNKMATLCITCMSPGSYMLLDAYYACAKVLQALR